MAPPTCCKEASSSDDKTVPPRWALQDLHIIIPATPMESQRTPSPSFAASAAARRSRRDGDDYSVHGSVASIPVEAVAPPTTFVEDMGHRSLAMGESSASSRAGGVALFSSAAAVTTPAFTLKATDDLLLAPPKQLFTGKCGTASGTNQPMVLADSPCPASVSSWVLVVPHMVCVLCPRVVLRTLPACPASHAKLLGA